MRKGREEKRSGGDALRNGMSEWVCVGLWLLNVPRRDLEVCCDYFARFFRGFFPVFFSQSVGLVFVAVGWLTPSVSDSDPICFRWDNCERNFCFLRLG